MSDLPKPRLCHLKKWADFEGYGFHLHTMKDSPGQFIGKVDEGSPADSAHLKAGDKIIEVNGVNVETENHAEVVQRIKSVTGETKLLVIEPTVYEQYKQRGVAIRGDADGVKHHVTADTKAVAAAAKNSAFVEGPVAGSRLCHLRIKPDFQGYGFNLQAEKSKPGQFIGKVESGSPAEAAGLRLGDRLLEINGVNVTGESHAQVVQRIKAVPGETRMLVVDAENLAAHIKKQTEPEVAAAAAVVVVAAAAADDDDDAKKGDHSDTPHLVNGDAKDAHEEHAEVHEAVVTAAHDHQDHEEHHHEEHHHEEHHQEEHHTHHEEHHHEHHEEVESPLNDYDNVHVPAAVAAEIADEHHNYDDIHVNKDDVSSVGERRNSDARSKDDIKLDEDEQAALAEVDRATDDLDNGRYDAIESHSDIVDGRRDSRVSHDSKHEAESVKHEIESAKHEAESATHEAESAKHEPEPEPQKEEPTYAVVSEHTKSEHKAEEPPVPAKTPLASQVSTASSASSSGVVSPGPVTIDGIHFPASVTEMREKMVNKKSRDKRLSSQISMSEKYKLFERL